MKDRWEKELPLWIDNRYHGKTLQDLSILSRDETRRRRKERSRKRETSQPTLLCSRFPALLTISYLRTKEAQEDIREKYSRKMEDNKRRYLPSRYWGCWREFRTQQVRAESGRHASRHCVGIVGEWGKKGERKTRNEKGWMDRRSHIPEWVYIHPSSGVCTPHRCTQQYVDSLVTPSLLLCFELSLLLFYFISLSQVGILSFSLQLNSEKEEDCGEKERRRRRKTWTSPCSLKGIFLQ